MPTFRTELPPVSRNQGYDLKRTPDVGALQAIVTCDEWLICDTHYWHGRTLPCEREIGENGKTLDDSPCRACMDKVAYRTHVYVSCFDAKKGEHFLFECTANAAKAMDDYRKASGTLRGCVIYARRPKGTKNGKVEIQTSTVNLARISLPISPNLSKALSVIWRIPLGAVEESEPEKKNGKVKVNGKKIAQVLEQPESVSDTQIIGEIIKSSRF